LNLLAIAK